jgi:hypothetical protein
VGEMLGSRSKGEDSRLVKGEEEERKEGCYSDGSSLSKGVGHDQPGLAPSHFSENLSSGRTAQGAGKRVVGCCS